MMILTENVQAIEIIGTYDFEKVCSYLDNIVALLIVILFVLFMIAGFQIGHYIAYRLRG